LPARSASKAARAAAHSAARSASHPVGEVAEPAMAPIIASPAPAHHGPIGGSTPSLHAGTQRCPATNCVRSPALGGSWPRRPLSARTPRSG
jgi:hypothetical protein